MTEPTASFDIAYPAYQIGPVIVASPHSGRIYPDALLTASVLDLATLRGSEDFLVDQLIGDAPSLNIPLLTARFARVWCDLNREEWELDPALFDGPLPIHASTGSARVAAGLGIIPRIVDQNRAIYKAKLPVNEAEHRIAQCWRPYHQALQRLIQHTRANVGQAVLLDWHSMPAGHVGWPDIVLGDAHGTACAPELMRAVEAAFIDRGFSVRRNHPYSGGYITRHYGRPRESVHVLQIEMSRSLYFDEKRLRVTSGFEKLRRNIKAIMLQITALYVT